MFKCWPENVRWFSIKQRAKAMPDGFDIGWGEPMKKGNCFFVWSTRYEICEFPWDSNGDQRGFVETTRTCDYDLCERCFSSAKQVGHERIGAQLFHVTFRKFFFCANTFETISFDFWLFFFFAVFFIQSNWKIAWHRIIAMKTLPGGLEGIAGSSLPGPGWLIDKCFFSWQNKSEQYNFWSTGGPSIVELFVIITSACDKISITKIVELSPQIKLFATLDDEFCLWYTLWFIGISYAFEPIGKTGANFGTEAILNHFETSCKVGWQDKWFNACYTCLRHLYALIITYHDHG